MSAETGRDKKKRMSTALYSRLNSATATVRSRGSSMLSKFQKELLATGDSFHCQELLLVLVELMLAFSWDCFLAREKSEKTLEMLGKTPREDMIDELFWLGWTSLGNVLAGQLMDCLTGHYFMAILNVTTHFALASLFLIVEIVHETLSGDVYALLLSHIFFWSTPPIKVLNFTRYVYAMDQAGGKGPRHITNFTFHLYLGQLLGHFLFSILLDSTQSSALLSAIAFCCNGTGLFIYAYLARPRIRLFENLTSPEIALQVWGVVFTALRNRRRFKKKFARNWLDYAENRYDKGTIMKTRRLLGVFFMAFPTAGFLLFTFNQDVVFKEFYQSLKLSGIGVPVYFKWVVTTTSLLVLTGIEYIMFPSLRACRVNINFVKRFLFGYISVVIAISAATIFSIRTEKLEIRNVMGTLRVYNTMETGNVTFTSKQLDFTRVGFTVLAKDEVSANFEAKEKNLFKMTVAFSPTDNDDMEDTATSYTQLFSVAPRQVLQYVAFAPSAILRAPGFLPVKQGPPGQNDQRKPRIYMVSFIKDRAQSVYLTNEETEEETVVVVTPGKHKTFQVREGKYGLKYTSSLAKPTTAMFGAGGLYGVYLYLGESQYEIDVDRIMRENTNHAMWALIVSIPMITARGIGQVALDSFVYYTAPEGLKGIAFGFYMWCGHVTAWFILIGFYTWHYYITPNIMVYYVCIAVVSFMFCIVLLIRYRSHYAM